MEDESTNVVLDVVNARRAFGDVQALDGVSLRLRRGEWLGLLGPNGAGKSTLVRAVMGRVRLDDGEVAILGEAGAGTEVAARRIGFVPQELAIFPMLTARENLEAWAAAHRVPAATRPDRIRAGLAWTGLDDRADEPVVRFSGGMKRRLNLACAVLHQPEILLLDEPTVGVDPQSRERIWTMLAELQDRGTSILLTTHQLDEAQQVCDRIVIIDHGRVIADGTLGELVRKTVGVTSHLVIDLAEPPSAPVHGFETTTPTRLTAGVKDVTRDLPAHLDRLRNAGLDIESIRVDAPTLQGVFIHLTGRELRE